MKGACTTSTTPQTGMQVVEQGSGPSPCHFYTTILLHYYIGWPDKGTHPCRHAAIASGMHAGHPTYSAAGFHVEANGMPMAGSPSHQPGIGRWRQRPAHSPSLAQDLHQLELPEVAGARRFAAVQYSSAVPRHCCIRMHPSCHTLTGRERCPATRPDSPLGQVGTPVTPAMQWRGMQVGMRLQGADAGAALRKGAWRTHTHSCHGPRRHPSPVACLNRPGMDHRLEGRHQHVHLQARPGRAHSKQVCMHAAPKALRCPPRHSSL